MQTKEENHPAVPLRPLARQPRRAGLKQVLRVALADDDAAVTACLCAMIDTMGHQVAFSTTSGRELVEYCRRAKVGLVITDICMPDMDGIEAARRIGEDCLTPVILLSGYTDQDLIERAERTAALAYLVKPVSQPQLEAAVALAIRSHDELRLLRQEASDLRRALADRKVIERAKGILMKHLKLSEPEAFSRLQRLASNKNRKLIEIAEMITTAADAFDREAIIAR